MNELLNRIHEGLDAANIPKRGRVKAVAEKTGYSEGMVSRILSGKIEPAEKFIMALENFLIRKEWIKSGENPILGAMNANQMREYVDQLEKSEKILDEWTESVNNARTQNILYLQKLIERLYNQEFKLVEDFIFELISKRK
jgi:transcriptional regulator with XRE-family HTH domain